MLCSGLRGVGGGTCFLGGFFVACRPTSFYDSSNIIIHDYADAGIVLPIK